MNRITLALILFVASLAMIACSQSPPAEPPAVATAGAEFDYTAAPLPPGLTQAEFHLYIPQTADRAIRGVIAISSYATGDLYADPRWRALAARLRFALLAYRVEKPKVNNVTNVAPDIDGLTAIHSALSAFGTQTRHPELHGAALAFVGLSKSAVAACVYADLQPDRTIAVLAYHSPTGSRFGAGATGPGTRVPQLHILSGGDKLVKPDGIVSYVQTGRRYGAAPWTAFYQANVPHHRVGDPDFPLRWLEAVIRLRAPNTAGPAGEAVLATISEDDGYLGRFALDETGRLVPDSVRVSPFTHDRGDRTQAFWLPDAQVAAAWKAAMVRADATDPTPPATHPAGVPDDHAPAR